jgi:hypothetical protein
VYLHPAGGMFWDDFLRDLCNRFTVYAPVFPGTDPVDTMSIHQVDDVFDVVVIARLTPALSAMAVQGEIAPFLKMHRQLAGNLQRGAGPIAELQPQHVLRPEEAHAVDRNEEHQPDHEDERRGRSRSHGRSIRTHLSSATPRHRSITARDRRPNAL